MATLFSPMGAEYNLASKHPHSEVTLNNISVYQTLMEELRGEPRPSISHLTCYTQATHGDRNAS